jgi:hypothetical protein
MIAAHVSNVYGIAKAGNKVFIDQIDANGPKTTTNTIKAMKENNFRLSIINP